MYGVATFVREFLVDGNRLGEDVSDWGWGWKLKEGDTVEMVLRHEVLERANHGDDW